MITVVPICSNVVLYILDTASSAIIHIRHPRSYSKQLKCGGYTFAWRCNGRLGTASVVAGILQGSMYNVGIFDDTFFNGNLT